MFTKKVEFSKQANITFEPIDVLIDSFTNLYRRVFDTITQSQLLDVQILIENQNFHIKAQEIHKKQSTNSLIFCSIIFYDNQNVCLVAEFVSFELKCTQITEPFQVFVD